MSSLHLHMRAFSSVLIFFVIVALTGCQGGEKSGTSHLDQVSEQLEKTLKDAKELVQGIGPKSAEFQNDATEEVEKLFVYEYKVEEVKADLPREGIEDVFKKLGQDRWECFDVEREQTNLRIFCRRHPKTYLRYIPKVF